ncbi:uncharacterized protein DEA37_0012935 [Paragonimus westermani]|uniref:Uncharacterized protein n=1 Tax=Paragonimus westermani TaxID=34504 RepID=A0A5J4NH02_9TREM|nr:uncharacterized protein DEA37_0012935 [Paragonimus westermani]
MKSFTKGLATVDRVRLPGWGPRDSQSRWLETLGEMAANRAQWRECCRCLSELSVNSSEAKLWEFHLVNYSASYNEETFSLIELDDYVPTDTIESNQCNEDQLCLSSPPPEHSPSGPMTFASNSNSAAASPKMNSPPGAEIGNDSAEQIPKESPKPAPDQEEPLALGLDCKIPSHKADRICVEAQFENLIDQLSDLRPTSADNLGRLKTKFTDIAYGETTVIELFVALKLKEQMSYCECSIGVNSLFINALKIVLPTPVLNPNNGQTSIYFLRTKYQIEFAEVRSVIRKLLPPNVSSHEDTPKVYTWM